MSQSPKKTVSNTVRSVKWTSLNSVANMLYGPLYKIVLAQFLTGVDFAYVAAFSLILGLASLLNNMGIAQAVLVEKDEDPDMLSTVLWLDVIKAAALALLLAACAPLVELYYELPGLTAPVRWLGVVVLCTGSARIFRVYLQKRLRLDKVVQVDMMVLLADSACSVGFLAAGYGVAGYVYGTVISRVISGAMLATFALQDGFQVRLCFDRARVARLYHFGRSVSLVQMFTFVNQHLDELIITRLFPDKSVLGFYFFAKDLIRKPQQLITTSISKVSLSAMAKVSENAEKLRGMFLTMSRTLAFIAFPAFVGIAAVASDFMPLLFGAAYGGAANLVSIFCLSSLIITMSTSISNSALYALKRPNSVLWADLAASLLYYLALVAAPRDTVYGVVFAWVLYGTVKPVLLQVFAQRAMRMPTRSYFRQVLPFLAYSLVMGTAVLGMRQLLIHLGASDWTRLIAGVGAGVAVYAAQLLAFERPMLRWLVQKLLSR